jgi:C-terminal peptidase prc
MPLEPGARSDEDRSEFDAVGSVRNRASGIAIPRFDGWEPMLFRSDGPDSKIRRWAGEPLPSLVPEDAGTVLTLKATGTDLVVESKVNIILARPDWHFVARWWVNDKPYIPAQLDNFSDANGQVTIGRRLLLHLDFDPRRIGAAPGDTIDLQLLYCKNGWELVQPGSGLRHASLDAEGPELLLSNRTRIVQGKDGMEDHASLKSTIMDVFLTGREQAVIDMIAKKTVEPVPDRFPNALNHALAVLLAKGCPKPDATRLVRATVESLVKEFERETNGKTGATQQETWVSTISRSKRFDSILKELVALDPHDANQNRLLEAGLNGMCATMGSGAACVLSKDQAEEFKKLVNARKTATEEPGLVGLRLHRWPVVDVMPGGPAAEAGLRNGDVVVAVNGNEAAHARTAQDASKILQGPPGSVVKLVVKRDSTTLTFGLTRAFAAAARVEARQVEPHVLLLTIPTFEGSGIADRVKRLVRARATDQTTAIILDLRDNLGGRAEQANAVADVFLDGRLLQICAFRNGRRIAFRSNPGVLSTARVILLTNNNTASAAEMLAMALRDNSRAAVVGEQTAGALFGKDLVELAGGKAIFFRTEPTVLSPTGNDHSRSGIPPDLRVRDLRSKEKDDILLQALELAKNGGKEHDNPN